MEPIAIIGAGMRFPGGVHDLESFAALLFGQVDAVKEVPAERWSVAEYHNPDIAAPGKSRSRHAGLLENLDLFDAEFFGISPREAERLDPVQRLILEVAWEALEHAAIDPFSLAGSNTGVYMGLSQSDYAHDLFRDAEALDAYSATGVAHGTAVGRLSYFLDLVGPSVAVDTASSGSLTAVHMARQALRLGECDLALAGGANIVLSPELGIICSKARMLSPDGRCRTFSADAQGYVRGEGCGVVVLRRLADARARGDRILGIIRGSAINQDGRSVGLTAPRGTSQEAVVAAALRAAEVHPHAIDFVEAHGTGTPLGDPVEAAALGAVLCQDRPADRPLAIGSVKTNIGHLESGAGVAGLLKLLVAFGAEAIPPNLHFAEPNPFIAWDDLGLIVPTEALPWPRSARPRLAGVSSFGFGGSNAHVIVEEPPLAAETPTCGEGPWVLPIAARNAKALAALAERYRSALASVPVESLCRTAARGRAQFDCRLALVGSTAAEMADRLDEALVALDGREDWRSPPAVEFVVAAPGPADVDIAAALAATHPPFSEHWQVALAEAGADGGALSLALASLWRSWGVVPVAFDAAPGAQAAARAVIAALVPEPPQPADARRLVIGLGGWDANHAWNAVMHDLARAYVAGATIDWHAVYRDVAGPSRNLPTYPFQRRRHWAPQQRAFAQAAAPAAAPARDLAPLMEALARTPAARRPDLIVQRLRRLFTELQAQEGELPLDTGFAAAGIDPMSPEVREKIEGVFGARLPPTLLLNNRNLGELTRFLLKRAEMELAEGETDAPLAVASNSDADLRARLHSKLAALR